VGQIFVDLFVSVPALMLGCGHKVHLASKQSLNSCYVSVYFLLLAYLSV